MATPKIALLAGASGLVGSLLLDELLATPEYSRVYALSRRPLHREHPRLANRVVRFEQLAVELKGLAAGASEEDLVNSGLEETMVTSYQKIRDMRRKHNDKPDLRTAAFIVAIDMIAVTYSDLGIFP